MQETSEQNNENLSQDDDNDKTNQAQNQENYPTNLGIGKSQKIASVVLAFFAFFIIILWVAQFKNSIREPFEYKESNNKEAELPAGNSAADEEELQKNKDTDGDGLSDWDELYFYNTSPYLEDSDSDGFLDKEEVDSENNPNCPTGRDCYDTLISADNGNENNSIDSSSDMNKLLNQLGNEQPNTGETSLDLDIFSDMDAAALRQILIQYGMDENMLNQISDEELMTSYKEILGGSGQ